MSPEGIGWENWRNSDNVEDSRTLADIARQNDATQSLDISKAVRPELEGYAEGGEVNPHFTMTNSGQPITGESLLDNSQWGPSGYRDNYLGRDVPAYGGGLTLPGGIDINANYQGNPKSYHAPDKFGITARKTWHFADGGAVEDEIADVPGIGVVPTKVSPLIGQAAGAVAHVAGAVAHEADRLIGEPARQMKPNPYPPGSEEAGYYDAMNQNAQTKWGPEMALNLFGVGTLAVKPGQVGIFGGNLARNADLTALNKAKEMELSGMDARNIHELTGWHKRPDGGWRFEVPGDDKAYILPKGAEALARGEQVPMQEYLYHPTLYDNYPHFKDKIVNPEMRDVWGGSYAGNIINVRKGYTPEQQLDVMLHEAQHGVQDIEGFMTGSGGIYKDFGAQASELKRMKDAQDVLDYARMHARADSQYDLLKGDPHAYKNALQMGVLQFEKEVGRSPETGGWLRRLANDQTPGTMKSLEDFSRTYRGEIAAAETHNKAEFDKYFNQLSEREANNVQVRANMSDTQRKKSFPMETERGTPETMVVTPETHWYKGVKPEPKYAFPEHPDYKSIVEDRMKVGRAMNDFSAPWTPLEREAMKQEFERLSQIEKKAYKEYSSRYSRYGDRFPFKASGGRVPYPEAIDRVSRRVN